MHVDYEFSWKAFQKEELWSKTDKTTGGNNYNPDESGERQGRPPSSKLMRSPSLEEE